MATAEADVIILLKLISSKIVNIGRNILDCITISRQLLAFFRDGPFLSSGALRSTSG